MNRLCFSFYNVNILQLNVTMWGPGSVYQWELCTCFLPYMFQLEISKLFELCEDL